MIGFRVPVGEHNMVTFVIGLLCGMVIGVFLAWAVDKLIEGTIR